MIAAPIVRPRFCPQCSTLLVVKQVEGHERRGCRRCGWIWQPQARLAVTVVVEHANLVVIVQRPAPSLPSGDLELGEDSAAAALRIANTVTGLRVADPALLGFVQTSDPHDPLVWTISFCYVVQANGNLERAHPHVEALRLRHIPLLAQQHNQYALDAYRAWLERHV